MIGTIERMYSEFFNDFGIDQDTGMLHDYTNTKFATMPYIGNQYLNAKRKILFIGMDIGKNETKDHIQTLSERRENLGLNSGFNPHVAGTYATALYLLKDIYGWQSVWDKICTGTTYTKATKVQCHQDGENPLSYIALTNLHKFVTVDRIHRSGSEDRVFKDKMKEERMLLREIEILKPDVVFFQGAHMKFGSIEAIKKMGIEVIRAYHPSNRIPGFRQPLNYITTFRSLS